MREGGRSGTGFSIGEPEDPAALAARLITEQAASILDAAEAMASEIHDRGRRQAELIAGGADEATALALRRLQAMSHELDALAADVDRRTEKWLAERGRGT